VCKADWRQRVISAPSCFTVLRAPVSHTSTAPLRLSPWTHLSLIVHGFPIQRQFLRAWGSVWGSPSVSAYTRLRATSHTPRLKRELPRNSVCVQLSRCFTLNFQPPPHGLLLDVTMSSRPWWLRSNSRFQSLSGVSKWEREKSFPLSFFFHFSFASLWQVRQLI
jgi:hypothetical protein